MAAGRGCHVWDVDGNEYIEYGMGLRSVTLGHGFPAVVEAVRSRIADGTNFVRPSAFELQVAEAFLSLVRTTEMVRFTKDGSTATTAALKLARAVSGRDLVAICVDRSTPTTTGRWWLRRYVLASRGASPSLRSHSGTTTLRPSKSYSTVIPAK